MNKTSTHIQVVDVTSATLGTTPILVRPPLTMKVFRCTIYFQNIASGKATRGYLTTEPDQNQYNIVVFASGVEIKTVVAPGTDTTQAFLQQLVLDRRGVGYMTENFYVTSNGLDDCNFVFIFEGITQST